MLLWRGPRSAKHPSTSNDAEKPCSADLRCWGLRSAGLLQTKLLQQVHCACWSRASPAVQIGVAGAAFAGACRTLLWWECAVLSRPHR